MTTPRTWRGRVFVGVSLDGFIARRDGDLGWLTDPPPVPHRAVTSDHHALEWDTFFPTVDHVVMGRATYETVVGFDEWPYGTTPVVVLSSTLPDDDPRVTVARDLDSAVALLDADAHEVYVDGGKVVQSFLAAGLVDELTVAFAPVLLGEGVPLFGALPGDVRLRLDGAHVSGTGMVHVTYAVHR